MIATPSSFLTLMRGNRAGVWTSLGGGILIFVIWQLALVGITFNFSQVQLVLLANATQLTARDEALGISLLLLGGFGPAFVVTLLWRKLMERKRVLTLFTARPRFRWRLTLWSAAIVGAIGLGLTFVFDPDSVAQIKSRVMQFSVQDWLVLSAAYSAGICVQATFEEVYVRGWLLQQFSRFVPSAYGAIAITAGIFCAMHVGHGGWATYVAALVFGLAYGWSALRLNGLEAAIGAHIANNLIGALLAGQMISGNPPTMDAGDIAFYAAYVLGFLLFVEAWARFLENPSRA